MSTVTLTANKSARAYNLAPTANYSTETESPNTGSQIFLGFPSPSSAYDYLPIQEIELKLYGKAEQTMQLRSYAVTESWSESTLTWNNRPEFDSITVTYNLFQASPSKSWVSFRNSSSAYAYSVKKIINYGMALVTDPSMAYDGPGVIDNSRSSNAPYIIVSFGDTAVSLNCNGTSPTSGFISKHTANTFKWSATPSGTCLGSVTVASSKLKWKTSSGASPTTIDCGTAQSYTFAAESFSSNTVMWQAEITDSNGNTSTSPWYTLTTVEDTSTAEIIEPMNTMLDGSVDNIFRWNHIISTGTEQTKADLQKSSDGGTTWSTLATVNGSSTSAVISGGTFSAGEWLWKVRTYNTDDTAGTWSDAAAFTCITAPTVNGVSATSTPRPTVTWQCSDQVACQVKIGGYTSDVIFGTAPAFRSPRYLEDGTYEVAVRAQNQYGLWSSWATAEAEVSNTAGDDILLTGSNVNGDARLEWATTGTYDAFLVYRDDTAIAKTTELTYQDDMAIGAHSYYVRGIFDGSDDYGVSDTVNLVLEVEIMTITDYKTKTRIELQYSTSSVSERGISMESESTVRRTYASAYPVAELSKHLNKTLSARVGFIDRAAEDSFKSLIGRAVIVKTPKGEIVAGPLTNVSKTEGTFFNGYAFNVIHTFINEEVTI